MNRQITQYAIKYLEKMHEVIGREFSLSNMKEEDWFLKNTWTREQEIDFKAWLVGEIKKDLNIPRKQAIKEAEWFILDFGWKVQNEG